MMGEQVIFTTKAHVFHIDPKTKKSWVSASSQAVNVSFFYDAARSLYRIISLEGNKAIINSTVAPNMSFTKTSQKFGQWSDIRANTVYGLGFGTEGELNKFIEKFQDVKEATRVKGGGAANGSSPSGSRPASEMGEEDALLVNDLKSSLAAHQRSQSLSGLQAAKVGTESPKHLPQQPSQVGQKDKNPGGSTTEAQLRYENDRLKLALAQSSANAKKWEVELHTLKNNNVRLTSALQESTANVEEWKRQLQALKEENAKLKNRVQELQEAAAAGLGDKDLEMELRQKDKEIEALRRKMEDTHLFSSSQKVEEKIKNLVADNEELRSSVGKLQEQLENAKSSQRSKRGALEQLNQRLAVKIQELRDMQLEISALLAS